jgi:tRNA(Ile2) C34 agmatinyltransferase TiaS
MLCCPRCGGTGIFLETGGYTGTIYRCKKCGYRGAFILEIGDDSVQEPKETGSGNPPDDR